MKYRVGDLIKYTDHPYTSVPYHGTYLDVVKRHPGEDRYLFRSHRDKQERNYTIRTESLNSLRFVLICKHCHSESCATLREDADL